jgi:hypothetical protein
MLGEVRKYGKPIITVAITKKAAGKWERREWVKRGRRETRDTKTTLTL